MKLKEILQDARLLMGIPSNDRQNTRLLIKGANNLFDGVECITVQTFEVTDGRITFDKFEHPPIAIKYASVRFAIHPGHITCKNGKVAVTYAFHPHFKNANQDVSFVLGLMSRNAFLYGVLSEYAFHLGLERETKRFTERFLQLISNAKPRGQARRMPA